MDNENSDNISIARLQKTKVLFVDNDRTRRRMVNLAIGNCCIFQHASDAKLAIEKAQDFAPNVVFLDPDLPENESMNVLEWITSNKPEMHVVLFTENADNERILPEGVHSILTRPFNPESMIRHLLESKSLH